jgi:hypothetical protein
MKKFFYIKKHLLFQPGHNSCSHGRYDWAGGIVPWPGALHQHRQRYARDGGGFGGVLGVALRTTTADQVSSASKNSENTHAPPSVPRASRCTSLERRSPPPSTASSGADRFAISGHLAGGDVQTLENWGQYSPCTAASCHCILRRGRSVDVVFTACVVIDELAGPAVPPVAVASSIACTQEWPSWLVRSAGHRGLSTKTQVLVDRTWHALAVFFKKNQR